jgi:hypothetical protein
MQLQSMATAAAAGVQLSWQETLSLIRECVVA